MSKRSSSRHIGDLEQALGLLDSLLVQPASPVATAENTLHAAMAQPLDTNLLGFGFMDDDGSLRPKSFLHDEMDEFNQIFFELARSNPSRYNRYLSGECNDLSSSSDGNETPVARLSPAPVKSFSPLVQLNTDLKLNTDLNASVDDDGSLQPKAFLSDAVEPAFLPNQPNSVNCGLYISEDVCDGAVVGGDTIQHAMRRSLSCAETTGVDLLDGCGGSLRLYDSLTSRLRRCSRKPTDCSESSEFVASHSPYSSVLTGSKQPSRSLEDHLNEDDADSGYQSGNNTMVPATSVHSQDPAKAAAMLCANELQRRINCFNNNSHGLTMSAKPDTDVFQGFIRVHMNLHKPINMALMPRRPSSTCDAVHSSAANLSLAACDDASTEMLSFYLPNNTVKVIHITSEMTTPLVIQTLLNKFTITDPCNKFALYEKLNANGAKVVERPLNEMMRRLGDDERPLELCLRWSDEGVDSLDRHQFILQDNVTGEIMWDAFSLPELEAFLRILEREEDSYVSQIRIKYSARKLALDRRLRDVEGSRASTAAASGDGRNLT